MKELNRDSQNKRKILIAVYNDINRDARVQRQINALSPEYIIDVLCCGYFETKNVNYIQIDQNKTFTNTSYWKYVKKVVELISKNNYDIIYGNDYYSCLPLLFVKNRNRVIYDAHELIIDCTEPRERFFKLMERLLIKRVDRVICASEQRREIMKKYYHLPVDPYVIRNISKLSITEASIKPEEREILSQNKTKIIYAGVLKKGRKIELLCRSAKELGDDYSIIIVGDGEQLEYLKSICSKENISNVHFFGGKKSSELGNYISMCDIGYLYYPCTDMNNTYCAPNKVYEYTSLGIPIIANNNPTVEKEVNEFDLGAVFKENKSEEDTIQEIKNAIIRISIDYTQHKDKCLEYANNNSWEKEAELLRNIILKGC